MPRTAKNIEGQIFEKLLVLCRAGSDKHGNTLWVCLCDCGKLDIIRGDHMRAGTMKSCGCLAQKLRKLPRFRRKPQEVSVNSIVCRYKGRAKRKGLTFELTKSECAALFQARCYYCGGSPEQKHNTPIPVQHTYTYNGIDRKENSVGYTLDNCVPCCGFCNRAKMQFSVEDFNRWIDRLVLFRTEGKQQHVN